MSTFVSVGNASQRFDRLLSKVADIASQLPAPVFVQYGSTPFSCAICSARPFVSMSEFALFIDQAQLVITHAGAGSVIHSVRAGKVPVVMARRVCYGEHVDDHQLEFAIELVKTGKIVIASEPADLERAIAQAISLQRASVARQSPSPLITLVKGCLEHYASIEKVGKRG